MKKRVLGIILFFSFLIVFSLGIVGAEDKCYKLTQCGLNTCSFCRDAKTPQEWELTVTTKIAACHQTQPYTDAMNFVNNQKHILKRINDESGCRWEEEKSILFTDKTGQQQQAKVIIRIEGVLQLDDSHEPYVGIDLEFPDRSESIFQEASEVWADSTLKWVKPAVSCSGTSKYLESSFTQCMTPRENAGINGKVSLKPMSAPAPIIIVKDTKNIIPSIKDDKKGITLMRGDKEVFYLFNKNSVDCPNEPVLLDPLYCCKDCSGNCEPIDECMNSTADLFLDPDYVAKTQRDRGFTPIMDPFSDVICELKTSDRDEGVTFKGRLVTQFKIGSDINKDGKVDEQDKTELKSKKVDINGDGESDIYDSFIVSSSQGRTDCSGKNGWCADYTINEGTLESSETAGVYQWSIRGWNGGLLPGIASPEYNKLDNLVLSKNVYCSVLVDGVEKSSKQKSVSTCLHLTGKRDADYREVYMKGVSSGFSVQDFATQSKQIVNNGFLKVSPYKDYNNTFAHEVDLSKINEAKKFGWEIKEGQNILWMFQKDYAKLSNISSCKGGTNYFFFNNLQPAYVLGQNMKGNPNSFIRATSPLIGENFPLTILHELSHTLKLDDEYVSGKVVYGTNCRSKDHMDDVKQYGAPIAGCSSVDYFRFSEKSVMQDSAKLSPSLGIPACAYVLQGLLKKDNLPLYLEECSKMEGVTIKPETVCKAKEKNCGGTCANLLYDPNNCGECGNVCNPGNVCQWGVCGEKCTLTEYSPPPIISPLPSTCSAGITCCEDGQCSDILRDKNNCGECGQKCAEGEVCYDNPQTSGGITTYNPVCKKSECDPVCSLSDLCCDKRCVSSHLNNNCGECGKTCKSDEACDNIEIGGAYQCVPKRGCCMFDLQYEAGMPASYGRCEDRDDPSACLAEKGYDNHKYGISCSQLNMCDGKIKT